VQTAALIRRIASSRRLPVHSRLATRGASTVDGSWGSVHGEVSTVAVFAGECPGDEMGTCTFAGGVVVHLGNSASAATGGVPGVRGVGVLDAEDRTLAVALCGESSRRRWSNDKLEAAESAGDGCGCRGSRG
jgi:hypothetical protein